LRQTDPEEANRLTACGKEARRPSSRSRAAAALSCTLWLALGLGCDGPTLWIGDAVPDAAVREAATDPAPPMMPSEPTEAAPSVPPPPAEQPVNALPPTTKPSITTVAQPPHAPDPDPEDAGMLPGIPELPILRPIDVPRARTACPTIKGHGMYRFGDPSGRNLTVEVYIASDAKQKPSPGGPLILYWHAVGDDSTEVVRGFGQPAIDAVLAEGGVVASFNTKLCTTCGLADDAVWYDQDDPVTDHVVACAIDQAKIDLRRIHSVGFSAGALRSLHLALARSNYIASVVSYSGGMLDDTAALDPNNKVPAMLSYGRQGFDTIVLDFTDLSLAWYETNRVRGYYSMLCQHDGTHDIPEDLVPHVLQFFRDHPYRVEPEPYAAAVPNGYPVYCSNTPAP
jgi:predicted esterase